MSEKATVVLRIAYLTILEYFGVFGRETPHSGGKLGDFVAVFPPQMIIDMKLRQIQGGV
jgi:hypothetical protein